MAARRHVRDVYLHTHYLIYAQRSWLLHFDISQKLLCTHYDRRHLYSGSRRPTTRSLAVHHTRPTSHPPCTASRWPTTRGLLRATSPPLGLPALAPSAVSARRRAGSSPLRRRRDHPRRPRWSPRGVAPAPTSPRPSAANKVTRRHCRPPRDAALAPHPSTTHEATPSPSAASARRRVGSNLAAPLRRRRGHPREAALLPQARIKAHLDQTGTRAYNPLCSPFKVKSCLDLEHA